MFNFDRILVPTDFSEYADEALKRALDLAEACDATIHLAHVIPEAPDIFKLSQYFVQEQKKIREEMAAEVDKFFDEQIAKFENNTKVKIKRVVLNGHISTEILKYEKKIKADMLVIATQGETAFEEFIFGSTSRRIIRYAVSSVLVVRKPKYKKNVSVSREIGFGLASEKGQN